MTTQGSEHDVTDSPEGEEVRSPLTPSRDRLVKELAASSEVLARARVALEAALAEGATTPTPQRLLNLASDLEDAADQLARAERLAEADSYKAAAAQRENEVLVARLSGLRAEVRTLKDRTDIDRPVPPDMPAPSPGKAPRKSLKSRIKRVARTWRGEQKSPRDTARAPTDAEAAAAIESTGLFDAEWYLSKYPDIRDAGAAPLEHFLHHGGSEGRKPGPGFDTHWYVAQSSDVKQSGLNPLVHYALYGKAAGLRPMNGDLRAEDNPDVLLLLGSPLFNADDYRARFPGLGKGRHTVAKHYLDTGWREGANPGPDFDGRLYLERHRDVKEAGANPLVHYLRHGRDEGREIFSGTAAANVRPAPKGKASIGLTIASREPEPSQAWPWTPLNALQLDASAPGVVRIGDLLIGASRPDNKAAIESVVATFRALARPHAASKGQIARFSSTPAVVVVDAWFVTTTTLRVRLAPGVGFASVIRCYQSDPHVSVPMLLSEQAVRTDGLPLIDVHLANPFASLLLAVDDGMGELSSACIIAFPSLARNGDHHAELAATANGAAPGALVSYAADLGREWLQGSSAGDLSLGGLEIDLGRAIGGERVLGAPFLVWLRARMGLAVSCATTAPTVSASVLQAQVAALNERTPLLPRRSRGMVLTINGDELPGLRALVSRSLPPTAAGRAALLVADVIRGKPRWLITPPSKGPDLSRLQPAGPGVAWPSIRGNAEVTTNHVLPNFPVAIRYQESSLFDEEASVLFPTSPDAARAIISPALPARLRKSPAVSVVLNIDGDVDAATVLATLSSVLGQDADLVREVILRIDENRDDLVIEARTIAPNLKVAAGPAGSTALNRAADLASGAYLLTIDAGVVLQDRRTLSTLLTLAAAPGVSSTSCAVAEPATTRNGQKISRVSGGVFPSHIDLIGRPMLAFGEPRSPCAIPLATYAVACNRMRLALVPAKLWKAMAGLDEVGFPERDYDLDFALRALETGGLHLCTTAVTALLLTQPRFDTSNDPGSTAMLSTEAWSRALERMTLVRDLG